MAKIQTYEVSTGLQAPQMVQPKVGDVGNIAREAAQTLLETNKKLQDIHDLNQSTEASLKLRQDLDDIQKRAENDYGNLDKYRKESETAVNKALESIQNPSIRLRHKEQFGAWALQTNSSMSATENQTTVEIGKNNYYSVIGNIQGRMGKAQTQQEIEQLRQELAVTSQAYVEAKVITAKEAQSIQENLMVGKAKEIATNKALLGQPVEQLQKIYNLTPKDVLEIKGVVRNQYNIQESERAMAYDQNFIAMFNDKNLTIEKINTALNIGQVKGEGGITEAQANDLVRRLQGDTYVDPRASAYSKWEIFSDINKYSQGNLDADTVSKIQNKIYSSPLLPSDRNALLNHLSKTTTGQIAGNQDVSFRGLMPYNWMRDNAIANNVFFEELKKGSSEEVAAEKADKVFKREVGEKQQLMADTVLTKNILIQHYQGMSKDEAIKDMNIRKMPPSVQKEILNAIGIE